MSTTYHIWHNGQDHGPYTAIEMRGMLARGELVGIQWRRTGDAQYQPHDALLAELSPETESTEAPVRTLEVGRACGPEPKGDSFWGELGTALGSLGVCLGIAFIFFEPAGGGALIGGGLGLISIAMLVRIHAKLALIAHRLQR